MAFSKRLTVSEEYVSLTNAQDVVIQEKTYDSPYIVIHKIDGTKDVLTIHLVAYIDDSKTERIWTKLYDFTPSVNEGSENFLRQAYEHLKSLPEFSGALDC